MESEVLVKNRKINKDRKIFFIGMALLFAVIFAINFFDLPIPVFTILIIYLALALLGDKDEIFALFITCIPLSVAFQYKYALLICMAIYFVKYHKDVRISSAVIPLLLIMVWELLHAFKFSFSIYSYLRNFSELILCVFLSCLMIKKVDYAFICRIFSICSIFIMSLVLLLALKQNDYVFAKIFVGSYRFGMVDEKNLKTFSIVFNPNLLGFICNLAMIGEMQLIISGKRNVVDYVFLLILFVFGVMTMSRTFILCFVIIAFLFALSGEGRITKIKRIGVIVAVLSVLCLVVYLVIPTVVKSFISRFTEADISNGRIGLYMFYNNHLLSKAEHLLFGIGLQDFTNKINTIHGITVANVCHNGIQEILVVWGIPGLILTCWLIFDLITLAKNGQKLKLINYMPLILIFIDVQFGQFATSGISLLSLSLGYLSLRANFAKKHKGGNDEQNN